MIRLSPEQQEIVGFPESCVVISCPGSGKTRTLTAKLIHEVSEIVLGRRVAAITYTNIASDEIHDRVHQEGVDEGTYWTGTIHSFCLEWIVRPYASLLNDTRFGFTLIDEEIQRERLNEMKKHHGFSPFVNVSTRRDENGRITGNESALDAFVEDYNQWLCSNKYVDYDLVLYLSYRLLWDNPFIAHNLSTIFKWILVDEYQDTQELQYAIIGLIVSARRDQSKVMLVGDPNQAIYSSLGGVVKSADELTRLFGHKVHETFLVGNYRSTQQIVDFFSLFQVQGESITAVGEQAKSVSNLNLYTEIDTANLHHFIAHLIDNALKLGVPHHEIVVIAPQWWQLRDIALKLKKEYPSIPLDAPGVSSVPKDEHNVFFQIARLLLVEPAPHRLSNRLGWAKTMLRRLSEIVPQVSVQIEDPRHLLRILNRFQSASTTGLEYLQDGFQFIESVLGVSFHDIPKLAKQYSVFIQSCRLRESNGFGDSREQYRQTFDSGNGVVLTTVYGCKGQEYNTVIAFGLLDGYLPHWNDIIGRDFEYTVEVSKRLLYVISSRSKTNLHLVAERGHFTQTNKPYRINRVLKEKWDYWAMLM